jgi:hypothetical protein
MKHHISWTGYLEAVMLLLVIYYGYVFFKYFLPEWIKHTKLGKKEI